MTNEPVNKLIHGFAEELKIVPPEEKVLSKIEELLVCDENAFEKADNLIKQHIMEKPSKELNPSDRLLLLLCCHLSVRSLRGYATVSFSHIEAIRRAIDSISKYSEDPSRKRPLNILMLASPGSGKSHLVECIASSPALHQSRIGVVGFNMVTLQSNEDLAAALDAARNLKIEDQLPLLFLDEFDAAKSNYSLLLPLLWEGSITLSQRKLSLGKIVIVLAGSDPSLPERMERAKTMLSQLKTNQSEEGKSADLFSRINGGVLEIPPHRDQANGIDRRSDKIMISIVLLRKRFGKSLCKVPRGWLAFVANADFRYDVRSIAHIIDLLPYGKNLTSLTPEHLKSVPMQDRKLLKRSSLAYHMAHKDGPAGIVDLWKDKIHGPHGSEPVTIFHPTLLSALDRGATDEIAKAVIQIFQEMQIGAQSEIGTRAESNAVSEEAGPDFLCQGI
jgi:hypothetical protein